MREQPTLLSQGSMTELTLTENDLSDCFLDVPFQMPGKKCMLRG
jgi:hypothetical protein